MRYFLIIMLLNGIFFVPAFAEYRLDETLSLEVRIFDENLQLTAARVRFTDLAGDYYAPAGLPADFAVTSTNDPFAKEFGLILDGGRKFAYTDGQFSIDLPKGLIFLEVVKGFRYQVHRDTIDVSEFKSNIEIYLLPAYNLPDSNWYSGDVHVHYIDPESALLQMKSEDLNICNILISDFTVDHALFRGSIEPISEPGHLIFLGQEFREDRLGHINLLNLKTKLVEPAASPRSFHYPLNIHASDEAHQDGGHVSWAHFAAWPGLEGPLGLVLKKVDAVELLCTIDPFHEPIFAPEVVPEVKMNSGLRLWYRLLNCGLNIPATAGTDKMNNQVSVGANRVFARVEAPLDYDRWIQAINEGKTFISNSPFLLCEVEGEGPGSVINTTDQQTFRIRTQVWSQFPLDRLEIIANGEMIAEKTIHPGETYVSLEIPFQPDRSTWIAARVYQYSHPYTRNGLNLATRRNAVNGNTLLNRYFGTLRPETSFAHTSPIYLIHNNRPVRSSSDANYFVKYLENSVHWLKESGHFPDERTKMEVLDAFQEGIRIFKGLASDE